MNTLVEKLLEVDHEARLQLEQAQLHYDETMAEIETEQARLKDAYAERARLHVEQVRQEEAHAAEEAIDAVNRQCAELIRRMEEHFDAHKDEWEEALALRCTGEAGGL